MLAANGATQRTDGRDSMNDVLSAALNGARLAGATYCDVRVVDSLTESISVATGRVDGVSRDASFGLGVRVIAEGAWGFASTRDVSVASAVKIAREAVAIARASAIVPGAAIELSPLPPQTGTWRGMCEIDPFSVPLEDKLALLSSADDIMRAEKAVRVTKAHLDAGRYRKWFASSEGSLLEQEWTETGAGIVAYAVNATEVLPRSYPNSHGGGWRQAGWEYVLGLDLAGHAARVAEQAAALLAADECPSTTLDLIIDASQLALQVHESVGHPTELDRVLGEEAAFAGTSWVGVGDVGSLRYGSEIMTVTSDATMPGSLGGFGWDDEGVPAQRDDIVRDGVLVGLQSSRETAGVIGRTSNGTMRADGWNRIPLVRMSTLSLEPGTWGFDDLVADTECGLYIETNNSWSIDDKRLNFQFATEIGWLIENGRLTRMVKSPNYTGMTPRFWSSCDAICSEAHWDVWALANCGKGEPIQVAHVAHGAAPARFRGVEVGVGR